jgi:hypothetical protein
MNEGIRTLVPQDLRETSTTQLVELGAIGRTSDNRRFVYAKAGGVLAPGKLAVAEAIAANHTNIAVASNAAIGATSVTVTLGATDATENQYAEGYLVAYDSTGAGINYKISGHPAATGSTSLTIKLEEPLIVALTSAASKVSLVKHTAKDVTHSTTIGTAVGVANVAVASGSYAWLQTYGTCSVLADGTPTKGYGLIQSDAVAGAVEVAAAATNQVVGVAQETFVDTKYPAAFLKIG